MTFISIADAVITFPAPSVFAILFYGLITMLGIGSMIGTFEGILTPLYEALMASQSFKKTPKIFQKKSIIVLISIIVHLLLGLLFCTDSGSYWLGNDNYDSPCPLAPLSPNLSSSRAPMIYLIFNSLKKIFSIIILLLLI